MDRQSSPHPAPGIRRSALRIASGEAVVVAGMFALTEFWLVPIAVLRLQAQSMDIALLTALPFLAMALVGPVVGAAIAALGGNRRALVITCLVQSLCIAGLLPSVLTPQAAWAWPVYLGLVVTLTLAGAIGGPAWMGLLGDLLPRRVAGRYTSRRLRGFLAAKLMLAAVYAGTLHLWPVADRATGVVVIIILAACSRLIATILNARLPVLSPDPPATFVAPQPALSGGWSSSWQRFRHSPLLGWTTTWVLVMGGASLAGPFFAPYMVRPVAEGGLGLEPLAYSLLIQTSQAARLLFLPLVGVLVDRLGPAAVLRTSLGGIVLVPGLWAMARSLPVLMAVEVLSGLVWCMAECALTVLLFGCHTDPRQRTQIIAWHQAATSLVIVGASLLGGWLLPYLPGWTGSPWQDLFLLSLIARLPAALLAWRLLPGLQLHLPAGRQRFRSAIAAVPPPITLHRGLLRFLRRPEG
jgi:MFS family permease